MTEPSQRRRKVPHEIPGGILLIGRGGAEKYNGRWLFANPKINESRYPGLPLFPVLQPGDALVPRLMPYLPHVAYHL